MNRAILTKRYFKGNYKTNICRDCGDGLESWGYAYDKSRILCGGCAAWRVSLGHAELNMSHKEIEADPQLHQGLIVWHIETKFM